MRSTRCDLTAAEVVADPYPLFAEERRLGGVAWHEPSSTYLTFDHASASAVLRDRRLGRIWTDREPAAALEPFNLLHRNQMMENEPPDAHAAAPARRRGVQPRPRRAAPAAGPRARRAAALRGRPVRVRRGGGVRRAAARPGDRRAARRTHRAGAAAAGVVAGHRADVRGGAASADVQDAAVTRRRASSPRRSASWPAPAPPSPAATWSPTWSRPRTATARLTEDEVVASAVLLLNAGHEASVNVFGNGLVAMLRSGARPTPEQVPTCVEEMLRYDSALQLFERTATEPVRIGDVTVEPGQRIAALLGAANRDPAVFADAGHLPSRPRPQPAPGVRRRRALLPRRPAGPHGARRVARAAAARAPRPAS